MGKKILVVDDSRTARQQVISALDGSGYEVLEAVDGKDGLTKLAANLDTTLVICDVNMPKMSGLEMLVEARQNPAMVGTPFLMLTTEAQPELVQQARQAGAKGWIIKPFKPEMLVTAVKKIAG
ncbi:MAG TPA: response regulator [Polyangiaceae bacterium]|nr:response regulator [Polyangiaceae bacterium]